MRILTILSLNLVNQAEENRLAELAIGLFFAGVLFLQPLAPVLKRWSFHQRTHYDAGCLVFCFMFPYPFAMIMISGAACTLVTEAILEKGSAAEDIGVICLLGGFVLAIVNTALVYRYFLRPKKQPRWKFLTRPQAEQLGDLCIFLNVICFQILWNGLTGSAIFRETVTSTPLGKPGSFTDIVGRLIVIGALSLLVYFPPRIFFLVEDKHRKVTWLTMLLANLPLILRITLASHR